ncbi:MAG: glycosyltransferase family 4 protein [Leptospirillia bacterium]
MADTPATHTARVVMLAPDLSGHNGRSARMAASLAAAGHRVTLYVAEGTLRPESLPDAVEMVACLPPDIDTARAGAVAIDPDRVVLANADVVQVGGQGTLGWAARHIPEHAALVYDAPVDLAVGATESGLKGWGKRKLNELWSATTEWQRARRIDAVLCVSYAFGAFIQRELKLGRIPVVPIYSALPYREVRPARPTGLHPSRPKVAVACGDTAQAVHAARAVANLRDVELVLINCDLDRDHLEDLPEMEVLRGRVHHIEVQEADLVATLAAFDMALVLPSDTSQRVLYDIPDVVFACIMAGLPMVASDLPGIERVVHSQGIGLLTDPGNMEQVADLILRVIKDPDQSKRLRHNLLLVREHRYNWEAQGTRLLALYDQLLANRKTRKATV